MTRTGSLYHDLLIALHEDAAASCNAALRAKRAEDEPLTREEIVVRTVARDPGDGRIYFAAPKRGFTPSYAGDRAGNEIEALCLLIERTNANVEAAGCDSADSIIDRAEGDAEALEAYRKVFRRFMGAFLPEALADLDRAAEADGLAAVMQVLETASAETGAGVAVLAL